MGALRHPGDEDVTHECEICSKEGNWDESFAEGVICDDCSMNLANDNLTNAQATRAWDAVYEKHPDNEQRTKEKCMNYQFEEVAGGKKYRSWKHWEEGDFVEGIYKEQTTDNYDNPAYTLQLTNTNIEEWKDYDGLIGLNSSGSLNHKMEEVAEGTPIRVEYHGTDIMEKGKFKGKEFHSLKVYSAKSQSVEEAGPALGESEDLADESDL